MEVHHEEKKGPTFILRDPILGYNFDISFDWGPMSPLEEIDLLRYSVQDFEIDLVDLSMTIHFLEWKDDSVEEILRRLHDGKTLVDVTLKFLNPDATTIREYKLTGGYVRHFGYTSCYADNGIMKVNSKWSFQNCN